MYRHLALSDTGFLFDTRSGNTYSLNQTATFLLRKLMDGDVESSLITSLLERYDTSQEHAAKDVEQFLFRLRDLRLLDSDED